MFFWYSVFCVLYVMKLQNLEIIKGNIGCWVQTPSQVYFPPSVFPLANWTTINWQKKKEQQKRCGQRGLGSLGTGLVSVRVSCDWSVGAQGGVRGDSVCCDWPGVDVTSRETLFYVVSGWGQRIRFLCGVIFRFVALQWDDCPSPVQFQCFCCFRSWAFFLIVEP